MLHNLIYLSIVSIIFTLLSNYSLLELHCLTLYTDSSEVNQVSEVNFCTESWRLLNCILLYFNVFPLIFQPLFLLTETGNSLLGLNVPPLQFGKCPEGETEVNVMLPSNAFLLKCESFQLVRVQCPSYFILWIVYSIYKLVLARFYLNGIMPDICFVFVFTLSCIVCQVQFIYSFHINMLQFFPWFVSLCFGVFFFFVFLILYHYQYLIYILALICIFLYINTVDNF